MKNPKSIFPIILKCIYLSMLVIFFFAIISIVRLHHEQSPTSSSIAFAGNGDGQAVELVSFDQSAKSLSASIQLLFVDRNVPLDQPFMQLIIICSISFLFIYFGLPAYNHLALRRPIKIIHDQLNGGQISTSSQMFLNSDVNALKEKVDVMLQQKASASKVIEAVNKGSYDEHVAAHEKDVLGNALLSLQNKLRSVSEDERRMTVVNSNIQQLERILKEESDWDRLVVRVITFLSKTMGAGVGVIYSWENVSDEEVFTFLGAYGVPNKRNENERVVRENGQLGEVARNRKMLVMDNVPAGYLVIHSGLGQASATHIVISPLLFKDQLYGAFELGLFRKPETFEIEWLERASESIAAHFFNHQIHSEAKRQLQVLTEKQAAELVEIHRLQRETFSELEVKLKEVEEEKRKNVAILEGCVDGVIVFDTEGKIDFCNQAAAEILGLRRPEVLQQRVTSLLPVVIQTSNGNARAMYVKDSAKKEISVRTEASFSSVNGDDTDVLITCTQARINAGIVFTFFIQKISVDLF